MATALPSLAATALPTWLTYDMSTTAATTTVPPMTSGVPTWPCPWWRGPQHILFQLANLCFGLSFLTPAHIKYHPWLLRTIVSLGALLLHVWGATVVCHPDVVTWYILFLVINLAHLAFMTYRTYPFQFSPQYTAIYNKHFAPFNVTRYQFKELASHAHTEQLKNGESYALEHETDAGEKLAVVISGRLHVYNDGVYLHSVERNQFVDSPEFEADSKTVDKYQVTITAAEDSTLLVWPVSGLRHFLHSHSFLEAVFTNLMGRDITLKLYQVQDLLLAQAREAPEVQRPRKANLRRNSNSLVQFRRGLSLSLSESQARDLVHLADPPRKDSMDAPNGMAQTCTEK